MPNYIHYKDKPEKIQEINKKYYEKNRDDIVEMMREKVACECGCIVNYSALSLHRTRKKHLKNLEKFESKS